VAALEVQQQQMALAAQSGEASAALLEMQPTVKNRYVGMAGVMLWQDN
jgi:hypothetical protein